MDCAAASKGADKLRPIRSVTMHALHKSWVLFSSLWPRTRYAPMKAGTPECPWQARTMATSRVNLMGRSLASILVRISTLSSQSMILGECHDIVLIPRKIRRDVSSRWPTVHFPEARASVDSAGLVRYLSEKRKNVNSIETEGHHQNDQFRWILSQIQ